MSAPAMKVRPAQASTTVSIAALRPASSSAETNPTRTALLTVLTGGLSTVMMPTEPSIVRVTGGTNEVPCDERGIVEHFARACSTPNRVAHGAIARSWASQTAALTHARNASMLVCDCQTRSRSAADLKFLQPLRHARAGTSNRKAALESYT